MTGIWARVLGGLLGDRRVAMVTVVATRGSAPRDAGARMVVHADGGFTGTIGGGTLEWRALALAQAMIADPGRPQAAIRRFALGPELGQCCGGEVHLLLEVFTVAHRDTIAGFADREARGFVTVGRLTDTGVVRQASEAAAGPGTALFDAGVLVEGFGDDRRPLLLFGAGHVGRALVLALAPLPFAVTWIDPRPGAFPVHLPANVTTRDDADPAPALESAPDGSFVLAMTHSHALDLAVVHAALSAQRFRYVGVIGSATKRARFSKRLADAGMSATTVASLVCPIGIAGLGSKAPAVIAAGVAAELLLRDAALHAAVVPVEMASARGG
jgi:xanthine dehydrogenase accessory factor